MWYAVFPLLFAISAHAQDKEVCLTAAKNAAVLQANLKITKGSFARALIWPAHSTLRVSFLGGDQRCRDYVKKYAPEWAQYANIKFAFVESGNADVRIDFDRNDGNWSYLGTLATNIPQNRKTMNLGALPRLIAGGGSSAEAEIRRKVLHEFGHSLGLEHEHLSPYSGFEFNLDKLYAYFAGPPNNWNKKTVDENILRTIDQSNTNGKYDAQSIMLYYLEPSLFATPGDYTSYNTTLSAGDKETIQMLYSDAPVAAPTAPAAAISEVRATISAQTGNLIIYPAFSIDNATHSDCDVVIEYFDADRDPILTDPAAACTYYFPETNQVVGYRKITPAYKSTIYNGGSTSTFGISTALSCLLNRRGAEQTIMIKVLIRVENSSIAETDFIAFKLHY